MFPLNNRRKSEIQNGCKSEKKTPSEEKEKGKLVYPLKNLAESTYLLCGCTRMPVSFCRYLCCAKWSKIDTREIGADDLIINQEVKQNAELDLGEGYTNIALFGVDSRDGNLGEGNRDRLYYCSQSE